MNRLRRSHTSFISAHVISRARNYSSYFSVRAEQANKGCFTWSRGIISRRTNRNHRRLSRCYSISFRRRDGILSLFLILSISSSKKRNQWRRTIVLWPKNDSEIMAAFIGARPNSRKSRRSLDERSFGICENAGESLDESLRTCRELVIADESTRVNPEGEKCFSRRV